MSPANFISFRHPSWNPLNATFHAFMGAFMTASIQLSRNYPTDASFSPYFFPHFIKKTYHELLKILLRATCTVTFPLSTKLSNSVKEGNRVNLTRFLCCGSYRLLLIVACLSTHKHAAYNLFKNLAIKGVTLRDLQFPGSSSIFSHF